MTNANYNHRLLAASWIALIGVGAVVWLGYRMFGAPLRTVGASSLPELPPEYRDGPILIPATEDAPGVVELETVRASIKRTVESKSDVFANVGVEAQRKFADAAWLAMAPVLTGSFEDYLESARALGADPEELAHLDDDIQNNIIRKRWESAQSRSPVVALLSEEVAIESLVSRGVKRSAFQDALRMIRTGYDSMGFTSGSKLYPGVENYVSKKLDAVELRCLTEMEIDGKRHEVVLGVALAWDSVERRWQPIERRYYEKSEASATQLFP